MARQRQLPLRPSELVYFVEAETIGLIKIGRASDMDERMRALRIGSPDKLTLLGVVRRANAAALESQLHARFAADRHHGEWFNPSDALFDYIEEHALGPAADRELRIQQIVSKVASSQLEADVREVCAAHGLPEPVIRR